MSLMDAMDDVLLGVDDDELDYDLEKDEEDALLADDNYEETYDEAQTEELQEEQYEEPIQNEEESDILDIDINVGLDETEEDSGDQSVKETPNNTCISVQIENDDDDEVEEQKERNRFLSERTTTVQRQNSQVIPDNLENVAVQTVQEVPHHKNNNRNHRGNRGRGRGRQNNYRGHVFNRIGNLPQPPPLESKTVLINPHFRGNVQASDNTRLVWDLNSQNQRYPGPQMAQVAPFQSQPYPWINPPYETQNNNFNHQQRQQNYPEPVQQIHYNQQPEMAGIRPLMQVNNPPPPFVAQQPPQQQPGNYRGRDVQFNNQAAIPPLMMNNPPPNFNQQGRNNFNFPEQNIPDQNRPFINLNHQNQVPIMQIQPNFPPPQHQPPPHQPPQHQPPQHQPQQHFVQQFNQNRPVPPPFEPYNDHNQFQYPPPVHNNQNYQGQNFQQQPISNNFDPNFIPNQPVPQESFQPKQFNNQFHQNRQNQRPMNQFHRTPTKRRSFEDNLGSGDRDLSQKKKRSLELRNLHEVPTVDMPDTTTEEKEEEEDEETKQLRLQIEEQKKLREKIIQQKEERRKMAAAQKVANLANAAVPGNLIATVKVATQQIKQQQVVKPPNQQWRQQPQQQIQNQITKQRIQVQQKKPQNNQQRSQNIQVTNPGHAFQRRNQTNQHQLHLQRVVMVKQAPANTNTNNRRVVLKGTNAVSESNVSGQSQQSPQGGNLSSFLSNRKVISNTGSETSGVGLNQPAMLDTPVVVVSNLAAGTTDVKIRKLCQGLGPVQNVQMNSNHQQATIRFKNIISAHKFFKKYQRKIIDLSMIQVTLKPES